MIFHRTIVLLFGLRRSRYLLSSK